MIALQVYSRPGCHLCDDMINELADLVDGRVRIEVIDITEDDDLHARFLLEIPVLMHGDNELSRYRLDRERLAQFVESQVS